MSTYFVSDTHFGHRNIHLMGGRPINGPIDNEYWITECWQQLVSAKISPTKQDIVYCLGDMAWNEDGLRVIAGLNGRKILISGNHDHSSPLQYEVYAAIHGIIKYKGFWLSHAPIHEQELRGKPNAHGHVHNCTVPDPRYYNLCPENLFVKFGRPIISLDELRAWHSEYYSPLHA
jgi:calcineurin-like phosphoesterase family protein